LLGIPVQFDFTFLLVLPLFAWIIGRDLTDFIAAFELDVDERLLTRGIIPYLLGLFASLGLFSSILAHELGHSLVGRRFNLTVKSITLWVLGGMAQFERIPRRKGTEAAMAIAGPLTSLIVAGIAWGLLHLTGDLSDGLRFLLTYLVYMNLLLAAFNLIPALPLDGGRVLRSLLAMWLSYQQATRIAAVLGRVLAILLGLTGLLQTNTWLMLIAFFIFMAVSNETGPVSVAVDHDHLADDKKIAASREDL
jgi:Zn-dependent protease